MKLYISVACMRKLTIFLIGIAAVAGCWSETHRAQIDLEGSANVALIISPMFSLQGDWHRRLSVVTPAGKLESDLTADTGWWRGSNLYRHSSGVYVLHEGQTGCVIFRVSTLELVSDTAISCDKTDQTIEADAVRTDKSTKKFPPSRFYTDLEYIGQFVETPQRKEVISFIGAEEQPEAELPDIL